MTSYYRELDKQTLMRERLTEEITSKIKQEFIEEIIINMINLGYNDETMHAATKLPMEEIAIIRAEYEEMS